MNRTSQHPATSPWAVEAHHLTRHFPIPGRRGEEVTALAGVDVSLRAGTFTAIVGASGSGKSTLLHCIAGLDRPSTGTVRLLGQETTQLSQTGLAAFRAAHVGFVFQEYNLVSALTAAQNVALPGQLAGSPLSTGQVLAALDRVGMAHRANQLPHTLSGGERQRIAVARVMASRPDVVFADEPTGALDPASVGLVLGWLAELAAEGSTVLMVTHDVEAASRAGEVLVMDAGVLARRLPGGDQQAVVRALSEVRAGSRPAPAKTAEEAVA